MGRITAIGERAYKNGEPIAGELTLTCEDDAKGNTAYTYIAEIVENAPEQGGENQHGN